MRRASARRCCAWRCSRSPRGWPWASSRRSCRFSSRRRMQVTVTAPGAPGVAPGRGGRAGRRADRRGGRRRLGEPGPLAGLPARTPGGIPLRSPAGRRAGAAVPPDRPRLPAQEPVRLPAVVPHDGDRAGGRARPAQPPVRARPHAVAVVLPRRADGHPRVADRQRRAVRAQRARRRHLERGQGVARPPRRAVLGVLGVVETGAHRAARPAAVGRTHRLDRPPHAPPLRGDAGPARGAAGGPARDAGQHPRGQVVPRRGVRGGALRARERRVLSRVPAPAPHGRRRGAARRDGDGAHLRGRALCRRPADLHLRGRSSRTTSSSSSWRSCP